MRVWMVVPASVLGVVSLVSYAQSIDLPTSKQIVRPVPGSPRRLNSLPMSMAVSPDKKYVAMVNAGYGTLESGYLQSIAIADTATGAVTDFPDERMMLTTNQTLYSGLVFSADGQHLYATVGSTSDPYGEKKTLGNGIVVYSFHDGKIAPERVMSIPLQKLAGERRTALWKEDAKKAIPFPAAIALVPGASERLLVADNLSDDALLMDAKSGKVLTRFDLSETDAVPGTYPVAVALAKDGKRAFVALWNASEVVELDLVKGVVGRKLELLKPTSPIAPGTHPSALEMSPDGSTLYVALTNRDAVAAEAPRHRRCCSKHRDRLSRNRHTKPDSRMLRPCR